MQQQSESAKEFTAVILGSGSAANAYYFKTNRTSVLIDNGFSYKELTKRLSLAGTSPGEIDYLLLTHSHGDHCKGVRLLVQRNDIVCYSTEETAAALEIDIPKWECIVPYSEYELADIRVRTFSLSHDTPGALGYSLCIGETRCVIITDTGIISDAMIAEAANADILMLEANYCPELLHTGPYPYNVKQRIAGETGHLSNIDAADFLNLLIKEGRPKKVYLCHLSAKNNHPELVKETMQAELTESLDITICPRNTFVPIDTFK